MRLAYSIHSLINGTDIWIYRLTASLSLLIANAVLEGSVGSFDLLLALLAFQLVRFAFNEAQRFANSVAHPSLILTISLSWVTISSGICLFLLLFKSIGYSSPIFDKHALCLWLICTPPILFTFILLSHRLIYLIVKCGLLRHKAVIVGLTPRTLDLLKQNKGDNILSFDLIFDDRQQSRLDIDHSPLPVRPLTELPRYVQQHGIRIVFLTLPLSSSPRINQIVNFLQDTTASVYISSQLDSSLRLIQPHVANIGDTTLLETSNTPLHGAYSLYKWALDIVLASLFVVLLSPLMLLIAISIKLSSPGPIIFRQRRYGLYGEEVEIYKFRTMSVCEDGNHIEQARRNDKRVTTLGAILRKTSLDELPQLVNVLQGRMSLVGPRPHAIAHNEYYRSKIPGYMMRHKVRPGITGWAQVHGFRGATETVEVMQARVKYDLDYLCNWSIFLDLWIILCTPITLISQRNAY